MRSSVRTLVRRGVVVYVLFVVVWNLLRFTPVAMFRPFALLDLVGWLFLLPVPVLVVLCLLTREYFPLATLLVPALIFASEYGGRFVPDGDGTGDALRIVTANVHTGNVAFDDVADALTASNPDVIAIHELDEAMSEALVERIGSKYPHRSLYPGPPLESMGLLSRYPFREVTQPRYGTDACQCQVLDIDTEDGLVRIVNVHIRPPGAGLRSFDPWSQDRSIWALMDVVRVTAPVVMLGDFNIGDRHRWYRLVKGSHGDAFRDAGTGFGFTWPSFPVVRLDYIFHSDDFAATSAWTVPIPGSDHHLVGADLIHRGS